jgi:hypothetical protein
LNAKKTPPDQILRANPTTFSSIHNEFQEAKVVHILTAELELEVPTIDTSPVFHYHDERQN